MALSVRIYLALLFTMILAWFWSQAGAIAAFGDDPSWSILAGITALYLCSHLFRMLRLALLTLDERDKVFPLIAAHTLTAFPSSFLPFKVGEVLRLAAFFHVYGGRRKALAVWLTERFGDVLVIATFILGLYLFEVRVPPAMRAIFVLFVLISIIGLLGLFAVAKVFVYLNRHLVLTSHSRRGLLLLRASHALRCLEIDIHKSVEGRISALLLCSVMIWGIEILALSLFIDHLTVGGADFASLFASGLLASLPGGAAGDTNAFGLYQSLGLALLTVSFLFVVLLTMRLKPSRP